MRSQKQERLDTGDYTAEEYRKCLVKLGEVGRKLGGDRMVLDAIPSNPTSILDVGCGGGDLAYLLARSHPNAQVTGIDMSAEAIAFAKEKNLPNLQFLCQKELPSESFDVITTSLVCHHMSDEEIVAFLKTAHASAKRVIINDLHRHPISSLLFAMASPILFRNRMIFEDGLTSIRRSFVKKDWINYLQSAGIENSNVSWKWPFRWIVTIDQ